MEPINYIEDSFLGCLFSSNYKNLEVEDQKKLLIEKKIYVFNDDKYSHILEAIALREPLKVIVSENEIKLGEAFTYLNANYKINDLIVKEIYEFLKDQADSSIVMPVDIRIKELNLHAKHFGHFSDISDFYKTQYKEHYEVISENDYFFEYNEPTAWNYTDWEDVVSQHVSGNYTMIECHLFSEHVYYMSNADIYKKWEDILFYSEILDFLSEKINESDTLSKLIFKDNGEDIFNHIAINYKEEKKQAFFNYLYYFLLDHLKKLKLEDEQSETYKSYVIKKGYLKKYGRMQRARATNKRRHKYMMNLFQEMYSQKFEQTMSN
jgi:hypothetical protein